MANASFNYAVMIACAMFLAGLIGFGLHFFRHLLGRRPEQRSAMYDGLTVMVLVDIYCAFEEKVLGCEREDGVWSIGSPRNLVYMIGLFAFLPLFFGVAGWTSRTQIVTSACHVMQARGISPLFCPSRAKQALQAVASNERHA